MLKRLIIGLMALCLASILVAEAMARTCALRNKQGKCLLWTDGVECVLSATGVNLGDQLECEVVGCGDWFVACENPGENDDEQYPAGINLVYFPGGELSGISIVDTIDRNGRVFGFSVYATPELSLLDALKNAGACPNPNWTVTDAVPCELVVRAVEKNQDGQIVSSATSRCTLPECFEDPPNLEWVYFDPDPNVIGEEGEGWGFERVPYNCEEWQSVTHNPPLDSLPDIACNEVPPLCTDSYDNDSDGLTDADDPGCQ